MTTTCTGAHGIAATKLCIQEYVWQYQWSHLSWMMLCKKLSDTQCYFAKKKKRKITYTYSIYNHYISAIFEMNSESNNHYISAIFEMNSEVASS